MVAVETDTLAAALQTAVLGLLEKKLDEHKVELLAALDKRAALTHGMTRGNLQMEESIFAKEDGQAGCASATVFGRSSTSWFEMGRSADVGRVYKSPGRSNECKVNVEHVAVVPIPDSTAAAQPPEGDVPGLVPKASVTSRASLMNLPTPTVHSVEVASQNLILGSDVHENCAGSSSSRFRDSGACGFLQRWDWWLRAVILALCIAEVSLAILLHQYGHVHGVAWDFTAVSLMVYFMVGYGGCFFLARALKSEALSLVAMKLQLHYDDAERAEILRLERRKYALAWLAFMVLVLIGQGFEVWNIQRGVLDSTIRHVEDLFIAKVYAQVSEAVTVISFAFVSGVILLTCYIQSVFLLAVDSALDVWCLEVYDCQAYELGVKTWNRLQALLKCLGRELESSTILLQAFGGIGFVAYTATALSVALQVSFESLSLSMLGAAGVPAIFLFLMAIRLGGQAASLTEKCRVLPAFVNQIPGACIDLHRQYLVQFIVDTSAGFIVKGVTLTQGMFLKQLYILATILTGVLGMFVRIYL